MTGFNPRQLGGGGLKREAEDGPREALSQKQKGETESLVILL